MQLLFRLLIASFAVLCVLPQNARADVNSKNFAQIYTDCGIGGMLFQHQKWAGLAALSNIIWDWGTTASSSAITSPDTCMGGKLETMAAFIYHSYDSLENDLAKGYGEHLNTLVSLAGKETTDAAFVESLRQDLAAMVSDKGYSSKSRYEKAEALYNSVNKNDLS